ncbi:MAG TPA: RDD family protein [Gemmatimonadales bacterium]|nr:RDD family protein [Gemmatimonadales bacterium]
MPNGHWRRWFARIVDMMLLAFALGLIAQDFLATIDNDIIRGVVVVIAAIPLSAGFLMEWGRTPGKALAGLRVVDATSHKLTYAAALRREWGATVFGMGFGLPLIGLFTAYKQYGRHKGGRAASYEPIGVQVVGAPTLSGLGVLACWGAGLAILAVMAAGQAR